MPTRPPNFFYPCFIRVHPWLIPCFLLVFISGIDASQQNPTRAELLQTVRHITQLAKEQQADAQAQAQELATTKAELENARTKEIPKLQSEIDKQAGHLRDCEIAKAKKDGAIWFRNCVIGGLIVLIGTYAFLKFYLRLPFL